ncbi:hypothetical protein WA026_018927 [Henosepilachna vigintioctopunctata]|uniref:Uncharacterized protein n=1 Tax=Henosepilachna vigintioctopunctata TaxID=420089 RepID=A0AAW1UMR3_9CUCU
MFSFGKDMKTISFLSGHLIIKRNMLQKIKLEYSADCDAYYTVQAGRSIETKIKEHEFSILNNKNSTGLSTHFIHNNLFINLNSSRLLHPQMKHKTLSFKFKTFFVIW